MILGVDGRLANEAHPSGAGRYCHSLISALDACDLDLRIYLDAPPRSGFPTIDGDIRVLLREKFWTHRALSRELRNDPPDAYFTPVPQLPWRCPCPSLVSVLDLALWRYPESFTWRKRLVMTLKTRHALRWGTHFIAVSESTSQDLRNFVGMDPARVTVIRLGALSAESTERRIPNGLPERYLLYVGQIQPRKNLVRLVEAFGELCHRFPEWPHHLVIAGRDGWLANPIHEAIDASPVVHRIHRLGYVPEEEMYGLIKGADVLTLVSLWEGFGLPALEAMAVGTAVLASDTSSLPEVVGECGVLIDPQDVAAIADGLRHLTTDDAFRKECEEKGRKRAQEFQWGAAATKIEAAARRLMS